MLTISPAQCRAARALLNWSQPDLADKCSIHVQTISNFEKETSSPSKTTLEKISMVLQLQGIDLLEHDGVQRKAQILKQYQGGEGFRLFMTDIYETVSKSGGDMCLLNANPDVWIEWLGHEWYYNFHVPRMEKLIGKINFRVTVRKGNYNFLARSFGEYRWLPDSIWNENSFYSFGDRIAFMSFSKDDIQITVLQKKEFAETFRFLFNLVWDQYTIIPDSPDHKPQKK